MADPLNVMMAFPPKNSSMSPPQYDTSIIQHIARLEKLPTSAWTQQLDKKSLLETLDPSRYSLAYLRSLSEHMALIGKDRSGMEDLLNHVMLFLASFDPIQIRYAGEMWRRVWERTMDCFGILGVLDFSPLSAALLRLDSSSSTFTSMHLRFVRECLANGTPSQALPILDKDIYAFPQAAPKGPERELPSEEHDLSSVYITTESGFSEKVKPEHVLEYYLLGAHTYIGLRKYDRARLFLEHVMLHPTVHHGTSALQVEAHKKWVLVGLLAEGKPFPYPRTIEQAVWKNLKATSKAYDALADSFEKRDWKKHHAELDAGTQIWAADGNLGLVNEAGRTLMRYRVADLQKTFAALPVSRVASHLSLSPDETVNILGQMIRQMDLNASLVPGASAEQGILRFHFTQPARSVAQDGDLEAQTKRIESLVAAVRDADRRLQLTREFIETQKRNKRAGPDAELADQMDLTWDAPQSGPTPGLDDDDGEEDIMA